MPYIGTSPSQGVRRVHTYTATANQTSFSGAGAEGATLSYKDSNFVDVYQNGVKLGDADYTATSGTAIVLGTGATVSDLVVIVAYDVFSAADTVSKADGGQFDGNVTMAGTLGVTGVLTGTSLDISGNIDIDGTANLDVVDIDGAVDMATTLTLAGNADFNGDLDVDGTTNLDVVDIDGAVDMASTLTVGGVTTLNGKFLIDGSNNDLMTFRTTGDTSSQVLGLQFQNNSEAVTAQIFGTGDNSSSGVFRIKGIGDVAIIGGDIGVSGAAGDLVVKSGGDVHVGTGDLIFATSGKGIVLGATSNTDANTLDDYEEGTWTPSLANGGSIGGTFSTTYTKVGDTVTVRAYLNNMSIPNDSNEFRIGGLPFTVKSGNYYAGLGAIQYVSNKDIDAFGMGDPVPYSGYTAIYFHRRNGTTATVLNSNITGITALIFGVSYQV